VASGTAVINFGAHPGKGMTSVDVTGQASILTGSRIGCWPRLEATSDHSVDEHRVETLKLVGGNIVAGTGFTIYAEVQQGNAWGQFNIDWVWA
jgi:hypothetical protein